MPFDTVGRFGFWRINRIGLMSAVSLAFVLTTIPTFSQPVPRPRPEALNTTPSSQQLADEALIAALEAVDRDAATTVAGAIDDLPRGLDRTLLTWRAMRQGLQIFSFDEFAAFQREYPHWPNQELLSRRAEAALVRENVRGSALIERLAGRELVTDRGKIELARALKSAGRADEAFAIIQPLWHHERLTRGNESRVLASFSDELTRSDHRIRAFGLLYERHRGEAERLYELLSADDVAIARAWTAVLRRAGNAKSLLDGLPDAVKDDPAAQFARVFLARQQDRSDDAAELLMAAPTDPEALIDPDAWWTQRRIVSRDLREDGDPATAYKVAAGHSAQGSRWVVEAEFHAGWYALSFLGDAEAAIPHFQNILSAATIPASKARANYWLGRAHEALGDAATGQVHYLAAARYPITYYGQLASLALGRKTLDIPATLIEAEDEVWLAGSDLAAVIRRLYALGLDELAIPFHVAVGDSAETAGMVALVTDIAADAGDQRGALALGKRAVRRLDDAQTLAFPTGSLPISLELPQGLELALIYSVSRQESAFNPAAISPAGARGLMQLMPATARKLSADLGLRYSRDALISDPSYNAKLGASFLNELIEKYDGSYILTFAAYNAGPGQADKWIARFGDPRRSDIDVIDWVEMISFGETRDYVQKLIENLQVYRVLLSGHGPSIMTDLTRGR